MFGPFPDFRGPRSSRWHHPRPWALRATMAALACSLVVAAHPAQAQDVPQQAGEVTLRQGVLKIRRGRIERIIQQPGARLPVYETDVLHTGERTRATVRLFANKDSVQMYSNSNLRMSTLKREKTSLALNVGKALFAFARRVVASNLARVETPTATIGVKGTKFVTGATEQESYVLTLEGVVGVTSKAEPERPAVDVTPDQLYAITPGVTPTAPVPVSAQTRERVIKEEGLETLRDVSLGIEPEKPAGSDAFIRFGIGRSTITVPFKDPAGSVHQRTLSGGGALLAGEVRLWGPLTVEAFAFGGSVDQTNTEFPDSAMHSEDEIGNTTAVGLLLGARFTLIDTVSLALHGGRFASWTDSKETLPGGITFETGVNLRGNMARALAEFWFENGLTLGLSVYHGQATPEGQEVERLEAQGLEPQTASFTMGALSVGGRF